MKSNLLVLTISVSIIRHSWLNHHQKTLKNFINCQRSIDTDMVVISSLEKIIHAHCSSFHFTIREMKDLEDPGRSTQVHKGEIFRTKAGPEQIPNIMTEWFFSDQKFSEYKIAIVSSFAILVWLHTTTGHDYRGKNQQPFYKFLCWI